MNWPSEWTTSVVISLAALALGIVNLILNRVSERQRRQLQQRNDRIECERMLQKAHQLLYGTDGFDTTKVLAKFTEADQCVRQALLLDPLNAKAVRYLGYLYDDTGNSKQAEVEYRRSLQLDPFDPKTHNALGLVLADDAAMACFNRAIELDDKYAPPHRHLAQRYSTQGLLERAEEHFAKATQLEPNNADQLVAHAWHLIKKLRKTAEAKNLLERAVKSQPNHVYALTNLGSLVAETEDFQAGLDWINAAIRVAPTDSYPYGMIAALYADRKEAEKALEFSQKATELDATRRLTDNVSRELELEMRKLLAS